MLQGLLSGLILFTSFSARTPNDDTITKDDYEIALGFKNENIYLKRDWERELGQSYIDDEIWFEFEPKNLYIKPQYVNKTSRNLKYGKADIRYRQGDYSIGYTGLYSDEKFESGLSMGIQKKKEINDKLSLQAKWDGYYFRDELTGYSRVDMEDYLQINWKISDKLILTNIFDYNDIKGRKYYKFKVGVEYELGGN
tara:strand:- start:292 stop:879 length:588 start_codon:yes stop_codon:yes gene_type:complete